MLLCSVVNFLNHSAIVNSIITRDEHEWCRGTDGTGQVKEEEKETSQPYISYSAIYNLIISH